MIKCIFIISLFIAASLFCGSEEELISGWENRGVFQSSITRTNISPFDTLSETGFIAIRKPDVLYSTENEFVLFVGKTLYLFSSDSDVGIKTEMEDFAYSDPSVLIDRLREDFKLGYIPTDSGLIVSGREGLGNIIEFKAELDRDYLPLDVSWTDIFGYRTILHFIEPSLKDPGDIFIPPDSIEFIEQ